jgi:hypothetical protein
MDESQGQPPDWVQQLIRDYQDTLTGGLYEAIYRLDDRSEPSLSLDLDADARPGYRP